MTTRETPGQELTRTPISTKRGLFGPPAELTPTASQYSYELLWGGSIDHRSDLPSVSTLDRIIAELEPYCAPVAPEELLVRVTGLLGCFRDSNLASPEILLRAFMDDLAAYPADVIEQTVLRLRRTAKFMPTISEALEVADGLYANRRQALRRAQNMREEYQRRRAVEASHRVTRPKNSESDEQLQKRVEAMFTGCAPAPDDFQIVIRRVNNPEHRNRLDSAYRNLEAWAIEAVRRRALFHRASDVGMTDQQTAELIRALADDAMTEAMALVAAAQAAKANRSDQSNRVSPVFRRAVEFAISPPLCPDPNSDEFALAVAEYRLLSSEYGSGWVDFALQLICRVPHAESTGARLIADARARLSADEGPTPTADVDANDAGQQQNTLAAG